MPLYSLFPFLGFLLSLGLLPLVLPQFWHCFEKKIVSFWLLVGCLMLVFQLGFLDATIEIINTVWKQYIPFVSILYALYCISSGIKIDINHKVSPTINILLFLFAVLSASFIGTTGASMLFIRPLILLNQQRRYQTHLMIFFIVMVSNVAGVLTPLGDPPLFLGYLEGVPFIWTVKNLFSPFLFVMTFLFILLYATDFYFFKKENNSTRPDHKIGHKKLLTIEGKRNFSPLFILVGTILFVHELPSFSVFHCEKIDIMSTDLILICVLTSLGYSAYKMTPQHIHKEYKFNFKPVFEVARVFLTIFITLIPVELIIAQGSQGYLGTLHHVLSGEHMPRLYFWLTGFFSSVLDNAPTYLVFFKLAGGNVTELITHKHMILKAISLGSVFMGAMTYIGNAPNFMVVNLVQQYGIPMPSFFVYTTFMVILLLPILILVSLIWL